MIKEIHIVSDNSYYTIAAIIQKDGTPTMASFQAEDTEDAHGFWLDDPHYIKNHFKPLAELAFDEKRDLVIELSDEDDEPNIVIDFCYLEEVVEMLTEANKMGLFDQL